MSNASCELLRERASCPCRPTTVGSNPLVAWVPSLRLFFSILQGQAAQRNVILRLADEKGPCPFIVLSYQACFSFPTRRSSDLWVLGIDLTIPWLAWSRHASLLGLLN